MNLHQEELRADHVEGALLERSRSDEVDQMVLLVTPLPRHYLDEVHRIGMVIGWTILYTQWLCTLVAQSKILIWVVNSMTENAFERKSSFPKK